MDKNDTNYVVKVEKAISDKYGSEAIVNPKSGWTEEKEKEYLEELKDFYSYEGGKEEITDRGDFLIKDKKCKSSQSRHCPVCGGYSMKFEDDFYMTKYECCFTCFIEYVEDREERWKTGWRPNR